MDAALLVASLRDLYRALRLWSRAATVETERQLCCKLMAEIEQIIETHAERRRVWEAAKSDLVREILKALDGRSTAILVAPNSRSSESESDSAS